MANNPQVSGVQVVFKKMASQFFVLVGKIFLSYHLCLVGLVSYMNSFCVPWFQKLL